jgi:hypothetical protein
MLRKVKPAPVRRVTLSRPSRIAVPRRIKPVRPDFRTLADIEVVGYGDDELLGKSIFKKAAGAVKKAAKSVASSKVVRGVIAIAAAPVISVAGAVAPKATAKAVTSFTKQKKAGQFVMAASKVTRVAAAAAVAVVVAPAAIGAAGKLLGVTAGKAGGLLSTANSVRAKFGYGPVSPLDLAAKIRAYKTGHPGASDDEAAAAVAQDAAPASASELTTTAGAQNQMEAIPDQEKSSVAMAAVPVSAEGGAEPQKAGMGTWIGAALLLFIAAGMFLKKPRKAGA